MEFRLLSKILGNTNAGFTVLNPEFSGLLVRAGQCQAVFYLRAGEKCGVEVKAKASFFCKVNPFLEMLRLKLVSVYPLAILKNRITCMDVDFFFPGASARTLSMSAISSSGVLAFPG